MVASYLVNFLISHGHPLEDILSLINISCSHLQFYQMKLDPQRCVESKTCVPMICFTSLSMVQYLEVVLTSAFPVTTITTEICNIILELLIRTHPDRLSMIWLYTEISKCQRLRCSRSFDNFVFLCDSIC